MKILHRNVQCCQITYHFKCRWIFLAALTEKCPDFSIITLYNRACLCVCVCVSVRLCLCVVLSVHRTVRPLLSVYCPIFQSVVHFFYLFIVPFCCLSVCKYQYVACVACLSVCKYQYIIAVCAVCLFLSTSTQLVMPVCRGLLSMYLKLSVYLL